MEFFDGQNNYREDDYDEEINNDSEDEEDDGDLFALDNTLDINKKNQDEYFELMESARVNTDDYWDINDPFVRTILGILFVVGLIGTVYYLSIWLLN